MPEDFDGCNGYRCGGSGICMTACEYTNDCYTDYFCANDKFCVNKLDLGGDCSDIGKDACKSGHCSDGLCCDTACDNECEKCGVNGQCESIRNGEDPDTCGNADLRQCDENGVCKGLPGHSCEKATAANDCLSGICNDNDYDNAGAFCVGDDTQCVHNGKLFADGGYAPECNGGSHEWECKSGKWVSGDCGISDCVGDCAVDGCLAHSRGCRVTGGSGKCFDDVHDPDDMKTYCAICVSNGFFDGTGQCCGDDPGEDLNNPGTDNNCCYNGTRLNSGISPGPILCCDGRLYYCNDKPADLDDGTGTIKNTGDTVCAKTCQSDGTWKK